MAVLNVSKPNLKHNKDGTLNIEETLKGLFAYVSDSNDLLNWLFRNLDGDNILDSSVSFDKLSGGSIDLTDSVTIHGDKETTILDQYGLDPRFLRWFPNKCYNSSFEIWDATTLIPKYWDGGVSSSGSAWDNTYSMKLEPTDTSTQTSAGGPNPQWWDDMSKETRVSFHKKGGAVTISVLDGSNSDTAFTIDNQVGNEGTSLEFEYNANWEASYCSISFTHSACTDMKVKFENTDGSYDCYIDGVIIEPDYTRSKPSAYSNGPYSIGNGIGLEEIISNAQHNLVDYNTANTAEVTITTSETTIVTKTFYLNYESDLKVFFSCKGISSDALELTMKTYNTTARTYQPKMDIFGINDIVFTYSDTITSQAAGSVTIAVKGITSNGTHIIPIGFATLDILSIPLVTYVGLLDVTDLLLTVDGSTSIDVSWTNPTGVNFTGVLLYRHGSDLASRSQIWCAANATEKYDGSNEVYDDTGLSANTEYFYKIFAVYNDGGTYYSDGVSDSATTESDAYQKWTTYPDTPELTADYPYQCICDSGGGYILYISKYKFSLETTGSPYLRSWTGSAWSGFKYYLYNEITLKWGYIGQISSSLYNAFDQANYDVYTNNTFADVEFAKTT